VRIGKGAGMAAAPNMAAAGTAQPTLQSVTTSAGRYHLIGPRQAGPVPDSVPSFMAVAGRLGVDMAQIEAVLIEPTHPQMPSPPLDTH
jgi:hypothetical protein